ncbi:MAG: hypothetical protein AMXMBFR53_42760 [Gemmatimonadota bacterium]
MSAPRNEMDPHRYRAYRESLGDHRRAARRLKCAPATLRLREGGHSRITAAAAATVVEAVHAAALEEDGRRAAARARRAERRRERTGMAPEQLVGVMAHLGWDRRELARMLLGEEPADMDRVARWLRGETIIPHWVAAHLRGHLGLGPGDPWPTRGEDL